MTAADASATTDLSVQVGKRIHMLMWDRRMTQTELGRRIGVGQTSISKKLRGERGWELTELRDAANALGVTVGYLFGEAGPDGGNAVTIG